MTPKVGDAIAFKGVTYEVIRIPGEEDGPPEGYLDVGRRAVDDPIGLAITLELVVWLDLVSLTGLCA